MSRRHFNGRGVKFEAFLPPPKDGKTSVFRHTAAADSAVRTEGKKIATDRGLTLHGMSLVAAQAVMNAGLTVKASEPPPRHANIIGWPRPRDPALQKAERKEQAMLIAEAASFELFL